MDVVIKSTHHISMNKIDVSRGRMVGTAEACPRVDTPPQSLPSSRRNIKNKEKELTNQSIDFSQPLYIWILYYPKLVSE